MYCYQKPFIGLTISININSLFFKTLHDICVEFDYRSTLDFEKEHILEYLEEFSDCDMKNPVVKESIILVNQFFDWVKNNHSKLTYKVAYHGSLDTPIFIQYNDATTIHYSQLESYCIDEDTLSNAHYELRVFKGFCLETMDVELFEHFQKNKMFGLHFVACSS